MEMLLLWLGRLSGIAGILMCGIAIVARLSGRYVIGLFQMGTLLQAGMAGMVFGCLCLLLVVTEHLKMNR